MRRWSQRADEAREDYLLIPDQALIIWQGRVASPDAILVAAVLAGAPTTWLWAFPTVVRPEPSVAVNRISRNPQRPRCVPKRRARTRRLRAIWGELGRLLRNLGDRWRA
jgi:hypothetical protein